MTRTRSEGRSVESLTTGFGRAWPSLVAGAACLAILLEMAWDYGGYFPSDYLTSGAIAFGVLALLLAARPPHYAVATQALVALAALAALAFWTGLSSRWSPAPAVALEDMQRTFAYLAIFGLAILAAGSGRYARHLVWAVLGGVIAVVLAGLLSKLRPDLVSIPNDPYLLFRLSWPLGYWNAYGLLCAMAAVLATGLAADVRSPAVLRGLAAASTVPVGVALYLSLSRGAWVALAGGLLALLALGARRMTLLASIGIAGSAVTVGILLVTDHTALTSAVSTSAAREAAGRDVIPALVALAAAVLVAQYLVTRIDRVDSVRAALANLRRPLAIATAAVLAVGFVGVYAVRGGEVEGAVTDAASATGDFVDRQWDDFNTATFSPSQQGTGRLTTLRGTRSEVFGEALDGFGAAPIAGEGAGAFEIRWAREREVDEKVRDAHSLPLETLSELGLIGALLLVTFIAALVAGIIRSRVQPGGLSRAQTAAVGAALTAWIVHTSYDWDWQMPAVTGFAFLLAACAMPYGRVRRRRSSRRRARVRLRVRRKGDGATLPGP